MANTEAVNIAVIGTGAWSICIGNTMQNSNKVNLVTCYDSVEEKRSDYSARFGCDQEASYENVLKRKDVDGVHLSIPNNLHAEYAILAAQHGKHVFVEKPIANKINEGRQMIAACQKAGVVLMVGHHLRRLTGIRKMKELIDAGAIGDPIQVEGNYSQNLGFVLKPQDFRWRGDDSGCPAGSLMTMGIHHTDVFNYFFGPVKTVFSFFNKLYIAAPVEDVTATVFQYENGVLGYIGSNYASPKAVWFYVYGTEANLLCTITPPEIPFEEYLLWWQNVDQDTKLQIFEKGKTGSRDVPLPIGNPILEEIEEFAECIQTGRNPETDGQGAIAALALIRSAIESAKTGKPAVIETKK
jgi:predicted dehydrogenase